MKKERPDIIDFWKARRKYFAENLTQKPNTDKNEWLYLQDVNHNLIERTKILKRKKI